LQAGANIVVPAAAARGAYTRVQKWDGMSFLESKAFHAMEANVKVKLCNVNPDAEAKLPQHTGDKSGIGVHYVDAWIKPMNGKLEDGTPVKCKRRD